MTWQYNGQEFTEDMIGDSYGYVYIIVNKTNNRKYIGKKFFSKAGYKTVKGKRKKIRKASDWLLKKIENPTSSSDVLPQCP